MAEQQLLDSHLRVRRVHVVTRRHPWQRGALCCGEREPSDSAACHVAVGEENRLLVVRDALPPRLHVAEDPRVRQEGVLPESLPAGDERICHLVAVEVDPQQAHDTTSIISKLHVCHLFGTLGA